MPEAQRGRGISAVPKTGSGVTQLPSVYLDSNATTKPLVSVVDAMAHVESANWGNPSSMHGFGAEARALVEEAREDVASLIGARDEQLVFTGSGTEANNTVLRSFCVPKNRRARLVTSAVEHASVLRTCDWLIASGLADVEVLPVGEHGVVRLDALREALGEPTDLVTVQWVNNETGVVQPIHDIAAICRERGVPFHSDAAQAVGKLRLEVSDVDLLTITAHKLHGPKGIGAIYARERHCLQPFITGGAQESGLRAGTPSVACIAGFGVAAKARNGAMEAVVEQMRRYRDHFEQELLRAIPDCRVNGKDVSRVCNTSSVVFPGVDGQAMVARLDQAGVACSQGSACESMTPEPSHVLLAMGLSEEDAYASVRFALSQDTTKKELVFAIRALVKVHAELSSKSRLGCAQEG